MLAVRGAAVDQDEGATRRRVRAARTRRANRYVPNNNNNQRLLTSHCR